MLIFGGGISNSSPNDDLWKYHFHTQTWKKLTGTTKGNFSPKMYHCILGIGVDFQTTSDFTDTFPSHCMSEQKDHPQLVPIPRLSGFCSYFCPQPKEQSNTIEMKTFSLPLKPAEFPAFQTFSETGLGPNRDRSCLSQDKSLHLLACSGEAFAAAQAVGEEERTDCGRAATEGEISSTNTLLLIGGKPLSSFSEISFRQVEFDCLWLLCLQSEGINFHHRGSRWKTNCLQLSSASYQHAGEKKIIKPSHTCCEQIFYNVNKTRHIFKSQLACKLWFLRGACWNAALFVTFLLVTSYPFKLQWPMLPWKLELQ